MKQTILTLLAALLCVATSKAEGERTVTINDTVYVILKADQVKPAAPIHDTIYVAAEREKRFTIGGYGEAVATRNFYSDAWQRYATPATYKNDRSHGRVDLPHVVIYMGYDFGKGWSLGTEIEFEHGGTEAAIELEADETGEYEIEIERGGEVALEQFWLQKSFAPQYNIRLGHMVVPVGLTNQHHLPTEFFTVYRQEGENTILPCTWHETGISFWGRHKAWRYEAMLLPGLDADRFGSQYFIHGGAGSPYEFKIANAVAGVVRIDNYSVPGLRIGLSGYYGGSFGNSLTKNVKYKGCRGEVAIAALDFTYNAHNVVARGNFDYAHLNDSRQITEFNKATMTTDSPSPKQSVASSAIAASVEAGYNFFSLSPRLTAKGHKMYLFGHYEYYDSMFTTDVTMLDHKWCGKHRIAVGLNYYPIRDLVIKAEYSHRFYRSPYNNEPSLSLGVAYAGFFNL